MKRTLVMASLAVLLTSCAGHTRLTPRQEAHRDQTKLHSCDKIASRTERGRCLMAESRRHYLYEHPPGQRPQRRRRTVT
ncbi:hypothetical protein [Acetobacter oeni]|uniref:Lipoprotein n=1 Tax=Acetobacter oeni TaxID=304077 RepID=A0A511XLY0_9PROT|nr:hypothetical protein [Acetobacter oeni]MBB3882923.1 hypothetical protein [Acetobacter oeni]NHO19005.1 hypothetical protein [Acetobacter oeni]GEN63955.1 hypothetical protein AOE01nite_21790 [Acetobacter oeni]